MADVALKCGDCHHETVMSEFVADDKRVCRACGGRLAPAGDAPERSDAPAMQVRTAARPPPVPASGGASPRPEAGPRREIPADRYRRQMEGERPRGYSSLLALLLTLFCAAVWIGWQGLAVEREGVRSAYLAGRWVLLAAGVGLVLADAFREGTGKGLLGLFFPPYLLVYALTHVESYWRRSLLLGAVMGLLAEVHFLPAQSLLLRGQSRIDQGIEWIGGHVKRAGEDPYY